MVQGVRQRALVLRYVRLQLAQRQQRGRDKQAVEIGGLELQPAAAVGAQQVDVGVQQYPGVVLRS